MARILQFAGVPVDKINAMRLRLFAVFAIAISMFGGTSARAQTTQPADNWSDAMERFSDAVRGGSADALNAVLDHGPVIRTFSSNAVQSRERLLEATSDCKQVGLHAYLKLPTSLASDLSDDFKSADVPESVRHDMLIPDPAAERSANEIAARWIGQILQPTGDEAVGVLVLWRKEKADRFGSTPPHHPIFLLVKANCVDGRYVFQQVIFGDPLEAKR